MTDEEVKEVALGILQNRIWTDRHCGSERDVQMSFMILGMMDKEALQKMQDDNITMVYEYESRCVPGRYINGMPIFFSCHTANAADEERIWAKYEAMRKAVNEA